MKQPDNFSSYFNVADNIWGMKDVFVNLYMIKSNHGNEWFLVDAGLKTSLPKIKKMAAELFGDKKPQAIILTHGHFDHIGSLIKLVDEWNVPVFAHYLELPYLTNKSSYPPGDPTVGGGLMTLMAALYPTSPIDLSKRVKALPEDGSVPGFKEWRCIHTPGHAFGHISLFRDEDKILIAGDAFVTTKGESALQVIFLQTKKISNPPAYFTPDWKAAHHSIKKLNKLTPQVVATGHGKPMSGEDVQVQLNYLDKFFYEEFMPQHGRYVHEASTADTNGVTYVPPPAYNPLEKWFVISAAAVVTTVVALFLFKKNKTSF